MVHHPVERGQMNRLDNAHVFDRYMQALLRQVTQLAAGEAGAAKGLEAIAIGPFDGPQYVWTVAGPADGDEQIARTGQVLELLDEDAVEAFVVAPGEDIGRIVGEAQDAEPLLAVVVEILA